MEIVLTDEQQYAYDQLSSGRNIFITGPGGTGKSTFISNVIGTYKPGTIGITAMTGCAAILIGGTTLHSYLGIGLGDQDEDTIYRRIMRRHQDTWLGTNLLIIDEISMLHPDLFAKLNNLAKRVRHNRDPFGGIQLLLSGDFYQLPCIRSEDFCYKSRTWLECNLMRIYFSVVLRQADALFMGILNRLRTGDHTEEDIDTLKKNTRKDKEVKFVPTRLFCCNVDVDDYNEAQMSKIDSEDPIYTYTMKVTTNDNDQSLWLKEPWKHCNAMRELKLIKGAQVLLLVNTDIKGGLVNGSRGTVIGFTPKTTIPIVEFLNGRVETINYHSWEVKKKNRLIATINQIPLRLAYAITIHKSQGMTLDSAYINLKGVFEYGQAYVALSRVRSLENLIILNLSSRCFMVHPGAIEYYS